MTSVEQANIRGLEIDKVVKAVTYTDYVFKSLCLVSSISTDSVRWYRKTNAATVLSPTAPSTGKNRSPMSKFQILESDITRTTSYTKEYGYGGVISMQDVDTADIDMLAFTVVDLTKAVIRDVDSDIWDVLSNSRVTPTSGTDGGQINLVTTSGAWTDGASNPIRDLLQARRALLVSGGYTQNPTIVLSPTDYANLISYLIFAKGSSIPAFSSSLAQGGKVLELAGMPIMVSPNVTADYAIAVIPQVSCTWKSLHDTTSAIIDHPGIGKEIRVWESGIAILQNPRSVCLISNTQ